MKHLIPYLRPPDDSYPRAALILDIHLPYWWRVVDTESLDLGSVENCLLGQIFGSIGTGLQFLAPFWSADILDSSQFTYSSSREEWIRLIEIRRRLAPGPECVFEAITQLDYVWPEWDKLIDLWRLNIYSPHSCIIGQLFRWYAYGCQIIEERIAPLGLRRPGKAYAGYIEFWEAEILFRRTPVPTPRPLTLSKGDDSCPKSLN